MISFIRSSGVDGVVSSTCVQPLFRSVNKIKASRVSVSVYRNGKGRIGINKWTYQLEVVFHGFTPEVIGGSIREVGDYQTVYTGFFGGGGEVGQPPPDDGDEVGEEYHRARQLRRHLLEHRQHTVRRRATRQRSRR